MKKQFILTIGILLTALLFSSCEKDYCNCIHYFEGNVVEENDHIMLEGFSCEIFADYDEELETGIICTEVKK